MIIEDTNYDVTWQEEEQLLQIQQIRPDPITLI